MHRLHFDRERVRTKRQLLRAMTTGVFAFALSASGPSHVASRSQELLVPVGAALAGPQDMPGWMHRGLPGKGHEVLNALVGNWSVRYEVYGTLGRRGDEPPIVSEDVRTRREWVGGGRFIEDTTEGSLMGAPLWRRGWLGYSNLDRRYEWITIDTVNSTMMIYLGAPGSGPQQPITMTGAFTDQGVAGEETVGKRVGLRTDIRIDNNDRHTFELYFRRPGDKDVLALRSVYVRAPR